MSDQRDYNLDHAIEGFSNNISVKCEILANVANGKAYLVF